ncbi:hypothetical protein BD324DRAFT_596904 [Kockovaella imperatae]|uniref:HMG box domain-containing protein n=1 Tax=Kockovaella imperatae TaxID=4999 RepID=A0A1Y1UTB0_9TREE|nr:hypothetical protein BD324DRAFT_596904 [Kockovaella imperatae]ORX41251.1 hypothetical protein BD324DRAFT_596904 [Kockovaella imperatae]
MTSTPCSPTDLIDLALLLTTQQPGISNLYQNPKQPQQQQRSTSNPRAYPDPGADARRDDATQQMYDTGYGSYQQSGYGNVGYGGYGAQQQQQQQQQQAQQVGYATSPSTSRRPSGQAKPTSTPPMSAPPTNTSPMYPSRGSTDMTHMTQSPYQPASAPPNVNHHMQQNQPQTAHPYGGGYYNYYDQAPWYPQGSVRPGQSSTPTQPVDRTPQTGSYDYSSPYAAGWDQSRQSWQTPNQPRQSGSAQTYYPPAQAPAPYPWQPWQNNYYPPPAQPATSALPPTPSSGKKEKKASGDYQGLGKRSAEPVAEDPAEKKKKGKKEEVKPAAPAKSHLHPPRQAQSAWQLFFTDELNKAKEAAAQGNSPGGTPQHAKLNVAQIAKDAGIAYANLNDEQKAYYAQKVQESKEQYARELAVWQATLTPEDIRAENAFRAQQRKEGKSRKGNLKDPNAPKKPLSAYFLFLKDIRENDDLRMRVWGDETETTKQSVLAAERWRSLTDDEKRPFLSQAEHDKQEYEAARKIYEDEAAARARGEDIPSRPVVVQDIPQSKPASGKSHKKKVSPPKVESDVKQESATDVKTPPGDVDSSMEFPGFPDLAGDMDLGGFHNVGDTHHTADWGELHTIMGKDDGSPQHSEGSDSNVDEAPGMETAMETTHEAPRVPESVVQDVAAAAEGHAAVPSELKSDQEALHSSDPAPITPNPTLGEDAERAFDSAALAGEVLPEAVTEDGTTGEEVEQKIDAV